jgi:hypothetical protein
MFLRTACMMCRMEEMAVDVTGRFYRAMSAGTEGVTSTSSIYSEDSVSQLSAHFQPVLWIK